MNKDQVKGQVDQAIGKTKEVVGKVFHSPTTQAEGLAQQQKGKVEESYGDAKKRAKDTADDILNK